MKASGLDFHVVRSLVEYKAPIRFDQEIEVGVRVGRVGNSSLRFDLAIFGKEEGRLYATGEIVWVYTDQTSGETARIGESIRALFAQADSTPAG